MNRLTGAPTTCPPAKRILTLNVYIHPHIHPEDGYRQVLSKSFPRGGYLYIGVVFRNPSEPSSKAPFTLIPKGEIIIDNLFVRIQLIVEVVDQPCAMGISILFSR